MKINTRTMIDVQQQNEQIGHHWFSADTKRFFRSRWGKTLFGNKYFVSSEQFDEKSPRLYTVREALPNGTIKTVGDFQAYRTYQDANDEIKRRLEAEETQ